MLAASDCEPEESRVPDTLVIIPTYREIATLPEVVSELREDAPDTDVLIVDDNSDDGTGEWAESFSRKNSWLTVLHRRTKLGLASAYVEGFNLAIKCGYKYAGQMDADGSHLPSDWGRLSERIRMPDAPAGVIGSRWVPGGSAPGWAKHREVLSRAGNGYIRATLGMDVADATAGYRLYRTSALEKWGIPNRITSRGYGFQAEMTYLLHLQGETIVEVPVSFSERLAGQSKMSADIVIEELCQVTRWGLNRAGRVPKSLLSSKVAAN